MLKSFEEVYLEKYWELQRQQWCNYFEDGNYDLSILDSEIYELVCLYSNKIKVTDPKSKIANLLITRSIVDKHPEVSQLRNRIDNLDNYNENIPSEIRKNNYKYKLEIARRMKKDVLQLMNIRNELAADFGYDSYPELVLTTEGIHKEKLNKLLNDFLDKNLSKAKEIIKKYNITFENWFEDLDRISKINSSYNPNTLIDELLKKLGFIEVKDKIKIEYSQGGFSGYTAELSPKDIRIAVEQVESLDCLRTLFHELGHAILYSLNREDGLFRILPASIDEAMAVVFEYIAPVILFDSYNIEKIYELMTLGYTRCAISALFEFDLWQDLNKAEELYVRHYNKFGLEVNDSGIWAYDSFRSIDPVYIHNYVVGAKLAEKLIDYLSQKLSKDYTAWGKWLYQNVYIDGSKTRLKDKIKFIS